MGVCPGGRAIAIKSGSVAVQLNARRHIASCRLPTEPLLCPEARITALHRAALKSARENLTAITNVLTGRPARVFVIIVRELGPSQQLFHLSLCQGLRVRLCAQRQNRRIPVILVPSTRNNRGSSGELTLKRAAEAREHTPQNRRRAFRN